MLINNIKVVDNITLVNTFDIKPYFRNPRKNDKTVELLTKYIPKVGFNVPIVLDKDNVIVKGHSRYFACIKLGMDKIPAVYTDADDEQIKLDRIADNKIQEHSEWLHEELGHELDMLDLDDIMELNFDLDSFGIGLDAFDFDDALTDENEGETDEERQKRFEEWSKKQLKPVTEQQVERAENKHDQVGTRTQKYYKFICNKCGNVHFVKAEDVWEVNEEDIE